MQTDLTRTGLNNIPAAPSQRDRAIRQARENHTAVIYRAPYRWMAVRHDDAAGTMNLHLPTDGDGLIDALKGLGYEVEVLA